MRGQLGGRARAQGATALRRALGAGGGGWIAVAAAVAWNLVNLRSETFPVAYLDDSSVHEQMVRFATAQLRAGHLPLTSWFPYLGLGSPQFEHYQSLPAMLTGALGLAIGPGAAFRWTLYLLLALWPVSVYAGARLFGLGRWGAAAAAAMAPFLASATGIGYEQKAYVWIGYGVWTQLWASMMLPLAWGLGWRAIRSGAARAASAAAVAVALTAAFHFETGYLAILPLVVWPFVAPGRPARLWRRGRRAAGVLAGALLLLAWVVVPLIAQSPWAATNEVLQGTGLVDGYGAGRVLGWLVSGDLLDHGRLPVVTACAALGLVRAIVRWRRDENGRALVVVLCLALVLSFGPATLGPLVDVIPGHHDLFFRRFAMGIQLAALLLAGAGAGWLLGVVRDGLLRGVRALGRVPRRPGLAAAVAGLAGVAALTPAWTQLASYDRANASAIAAQQRAERTQAPALDRLLAMGRRRGGGRVYAGAPTNWGTALTVGSVPVFKFLEARDVPEVGYTLRTAALMTIPEYWFDDTVPGDYVLFGVRWIVSAAGDDVSVPARRVACAGRYCLWAVAGVPGYVRAGSVVGVLAADRTNVGARSIPLLRTGLAARGRYLKVDWRGAGPSLSAADLQALPRPPAAGAVVAARAALGDGTAVAELRMRRPGVAVLSASFDPGWTVSVDGRRERPEMIAPALVGAPVPAGRHRVTFRFRGFGWYPELFAVSGLTLVGLVVLALRRRPRA